MTLPSVGYEGIVAAQVDRAGNLRLYRRGRVFRRQDVFHPAGAWTSYTVNLHGAAVVMLRPVSDREG